MTSGRWPQVPFFSDPATVEAAVERQWKQITNDVPFEAKFSEDVIRELYKAEDSRAQIFARGPVCRAVSGLLSMTCRRKLHLRRSAISAGGRSWTTRRSCASSSAPS